MPDIRFSKEIQNRYQFGAFCHGRGLVGTAMELGVNRGEFAGHFLAGWGGARYHAVDVYQPYVDMPGDRSIDRQIAHTRLARFSDRVEWDERDCFHALCEQPPESLDFLYIDGEHTYWAVMMEIREGWPRVKPGGVMAGHDYTAGIPDVVRAVDEFSDREGVTVWIVKDPMSLWSWYCIKEDKK